MHRRLIALVAVASLLVAALPATVIAQPSGAAVAKGHAKVVEQAPDGVYIIQLAEEPAVAYSGGIKGYAATAPSEGKKLDSTDANVKRYVAYLTNRHDQILAGVGAGTASKIYSYAYALNGFAAVLTHSQATKLAGTAGIVSVEADRLHQKTTDNSPTFLGLNDEDGGLVEDLGLTGEDVIVGIIDTGIWPEHPSFSDQGDLADRPGNSGKRSRVYGPPPASWHGTCQSGELWAQDDCNNKLIGARYFLAGFKKHGIIHDDYKSARDADGHGSHTASTAAGNAGVEASIFEVNRGTVSGMAPRARIAVYKGLWNAQGGFTSDLAAAINAAVGDGVDVISYSIGSDTPSFTSADAIAFLNATQRNGVFASVSAGNAGPDAGTVGAPAAAPWVMTVGASTQDRTFRGSVTVGGTTYFGASVTASTGPLLIVDAATAGDELCQVGELDPSLVAGKIVLCKRGGNARVDKSKAVAVAGGAGMVLFNDFDPQSLVTDNHWVPSVHISFADGDAIKTYIAGHLGATAQITGGVATGAQGSVMADFSSRGPNGADGDLLKPDVTAPGVNILAGNTPTPFSGFPGQLFQSISGTSMSAPHVAGLAALLKEAHPTWGANEIKSALMLTARQDVEKEDGTTDGDAFDFGAGHVVPNSAVDPGVVMTETRTNFLSYLCFEAPFLINPTTCATIGTLAGRGLNLASISVSQLVGSETVGRTFTSVDPDTATWTPSVEGLSGITVTMPAPVTLASGLSASWSVTFTRDTAALDTAALDAWAQGAIVWTSNDGHTVRLPVVLKPTQLGFPGVVTADVTTGSGLVEWDVKSGYDGDLYADGYGLDVDAAIGGQFVAQDPDQDITTDTFTSGVKVYDYALGANVRYFAAGTAGNTTTPGSDLDVFLFQELADGNAGYSYDDLVALSADGDSDEIAELVNPAAGNYRLVVHGWGTPGGAGSTFTLHEWLVDQAAADDVNLDATACVGDPATCTDPATVVLGQVVGIDAAVNGLSAAGQYRGIVTYRDDGGAIGTTVLIVNR